MTLKDFIRQNRPALDDYIKSRAPNIKSLNDEERADWLRNDEFLYTYARSEGVSI